jgi:hypothetical protein
MKNLVALVLLTVIGHYSTGSAVAQTSAHCLARSGEDVTNTCGYTVNAAWYDGGWKAWFFEPGDTYSMPSLVRSVGVFACRSPGGVRYSAGRPVGCRQ